MQGEVAAAAEVKTEGAVSQERRPARRPGPGWSCHPRMLTIIAMLLTVPKKQDVSGAVDGPP